MYSRYRLAQKYLHYYLSAANGKGHGIHSPFVFEFVQQVLNDRRRYPEYAAIEGLRSRLRGDRTMLEIEDLGAGSAWKVGGEDVAGGEDLAGRAEGPGVARKVLRQRSIGDLTRHAAKPARLGQLLYRIARYYRVERVVELGTSLGFSTAYLAAGMAGGRGDGGLGGGGAVGAAVLGGGVSGAAAGGVDFSGGLWSIEGASTVAAAAGRNLDSLGLSARLVTGNFDDVLPGVLSEMGTVDLAFVDGNHRRDPTLAYFERLMARAARPAVLIFDDIHWSAEMEEAWAAIRNDSRVYLTIDLFFIGLVFLREEFLVKQDFVIRF